MTSSMLKQNLMSLSMYDESTSNGILVNVYQNGNGTSSHNSSYGDGLDKLKEAASVITGTVLVSLPVEVDRQRQ